MEALSDQLSSCIPGSESVLVTLTVETRGGLPTCVERTSSHPSARCAAAVVAHGLVLPEAPSEEMCRFRYPLRFTGGADP